MNSHEKFMAYCINAARKAGKATQKNPMVGSVLVYKDMVIGEGIHEQYGQAHAERNAIDRALQNYPDLVQESTLYVTLEPCFHQGNTPPCVQHILKHNIQKVIIGTIDPNPLVGGKSIALLKEKGIDVQYGILQNECKFLIRKFIANLSHRPYIILKYAQSYDGFLGQADKQIWLSNQYSKILVHKWRSEVDGIMVGTKTVLIDDPQLTTREWPGDDPTRIVPDFKGRISASANIYNSDTKTLILTDDPSSAMNRKNVYFIKAEYQNIASYWESIFAEGIYSILIEGGQKIIKSVLESNLWDEARIITSPKRLKSGIKAPTIKGRLSQKQTLSGDIIHTILQDSA